MLEPLKVTITNPPADYPRSLDVTDFPADSSRGSHSVPFSAELYIERSDFREVITLTV